MNEIDQQIIKFNQKKDFKDDDFFVSSSNRAVFNFLDEWPKWPKNFLSISGEHYSGKSHLTSVFINKYKGIKFNANELNDDDLDRIKNYQNIVIEDFNKEVNENLIYTLIDLIEQDHKYLIITSVAPIVNINFNLNDLKSRLKNFILLSIKNPDDEMIFALILKNLSDRQISLDKKLVDFIVKRIHRSYSKIFDFIYKIDELSLKRKKSIDVKIIKEVLGE